MKLKTAIVINLTLVLTNLLIIIFGMLLSFLGPIWYTIITFVILVQFIIGAFFNKKSIIIGLFMTAILVTVYWCKIYCIVNVLPCTLLFGILFKLMFTRKINEEKKRPYEIYAYSSVIFEVITLIMVVIETR